MRTYKKVKIRDKGDNDEEMACEENEGAINDSTTWSGTQKQSFPDEVGLGRDASSDMAPPSYGPEILEEARVVETMANKVSFKDKLLNSEPADTGAQELLPDECDVFVALEGLVPAITFSQRIQDFMAQCMKHAGVVKLLGRYIRQDKLQVAESDLKAVGVTFLFLNK